MESMRSQLKQMLPQFQSLKQIGVHKGLAKFGDLVTNMVYSMAKSIIIQQLDQRKVNKKILSNALKQANMKPFAKNRSSAHDMADTAEAFIGYMYCVEEWSIEEMALMLSPILEEYDLRNYKEEIPAGIAAFTFLLSKIKEVLTPQFL